MQIIFLLFFAGLFISQSLMDAFFSLGVLYGLFAVVKNKTKWNSPWLWLWFSLGFWAVSVFSRFINSAPLKWGELLENRWCLEILLFVLVVRRIKNWTATFERMAWILTALQVFSFFWFYFFREAASPLTERFGGLHTNPMFWAQTTAITGVFFLGLFLLTKESKRIQISFAVAALISLLGLLITGTRGAWIGYFLTLPLFLYLWNPKRFWIHFSGLIVAAVLIGLFVKPVRERIEFTIAGLQGQATYDAERRALWKANWMMFVDNPILGVGFGENKAHLRRYYDQMNLPQGQFESHAHNQYLQVLGGTGILGFIAYMGVFGAFLFYAWRLARSHKAWSSAIGWASIGAIIVFMLASLTEANFNISKTRYALFFVWIVILAFWPSQLDHSSGTSSLNSTKK